MIRIEISANALPKFLKCDALSGLGSEVRPGLAGLGPPVKGQRIFDTVPGLLGMAMLR
jgi:hypothetical protein